MLHQRQTTLVHWRKGMRTILVLPLLTFLFSVNAGGQSPPPPPPPPCGGPGQSPCRSFTVHPARFPRPGIFHIDLIATVITLTGPLTCDQDVKITPAGPLRSVGDQQITPAIIEIPPTLASTPERPWPMVECFATTSIGSWVFYIAIGPEPPPPGPPPGPSPQVAQFDTNRNGVIDDPEFFVVIDLWVAGQIPDDLFFAVIDAWVLQAPVRGTSLSSAQPVGLALSATRGSITFTVRGPDIASLAMEVYDLSGQRVFSRQASGTRLTWNLKTSSGKPLANGVYLATITIQRLEGQISRELRKILILR